MDRIIKMTVSIDYTNLILTLVKIFGNFEARPIRLYSTASSFRFDILHPVYL